ncbi:MAG: tetratricopeptide repeat protein [Planctomycetes bacterium]|nr:tetratricopeptide repeat protein [Planctomycetota bacterium]
MMPRLSFHLTLLWLGLAALPLDLRAQDESAASLLASARTETQRGEHEKAYALLEKAVKLRDANRDTRFALAECCIATGRSSEAMDLLDALDAEEHSEVRVPRLWVTVLDMRIAELAQGSGAERTIFMRKGDLRDHLVRIVQMDRKDLASMRRLLALCMELRDADNLQRWSTWARSNFPTEGDGYVAAGDVHFLQFLDRKEAEDDAGATAALAKAREAYVEGTNKTPDAAMTWERLGRCAEWAGKPDEAARNYAEALARDPGAVDVAALSGRLGDQAVVMLERAVKGYDERHPGGATKQESLLRYYAGWYLSYRKEGGAAEGVKQLQLAVDHEPSYADCWYHIGIKCAYDLKDYDRAAEAFAKIGDSGPERFAAFAQQNGGDPANLKTTLQFLIVTMNTKARFDLCRGLAACVVSLEPKNADEWNNYAFFCRESRDYERSIVAYERALGLSPEDPAFLNDTALILHFHLYERKDAMTRAIAMYEKAIQCAKAELAKGNLSDERKQIVQIALRDATNNLALAKKGERRRG